MLEIPVVIEPSHSFAPSIAVSKFNLYIHNLFLLEITTNLPEKIRFEGKVMPQTDWEGVSIERRTNPFACLGLE